MSDLFLTQSDLNTIREIVEVDTKEDLYLNNNLMSFISKKPMGGVPWLMVLPSIVAAFVSGAMMLALHRVVG